MAKFIGFEKGMGIGGWLTNYKRFNVLPENKRLDITIGDEEHFKTYITEDDVRYIASLGVDHIRLGFDQIVLEETPYVYREYVIDLLRSFVSWCEKYHLNVIFNLHKAIGNYCDIPEKKQLLDDDELQERFIALWLELEKQFADKPQIVFELLNEVRDVDPEKWNGLADKTIKELRKTNKERLIMIGSTGWNSPDTLKDLKIWDDDRVVYTFHTYTPFEFTHQRGVLVDNTLYYNRHMEYPAPIDKYVEFRRLLGYDEHIYDGMEQMDIHALEHFMQGAFEFAAAHPDKVLTCGEFGTIRHCNIKYRENWMRDMIRLLKKHNISYCVWNYLSTPNDGNRFSLVDDDNRHILSEELGRIIIGDVD